MPPIHALCMQCTLPYVATCVLVLVAVPTDSSTLSSCSFFPVSFCTLVDARSLARSLLLAVSAAAASSHSFSSLSSTLVFYAVSLYLFHSVQFSSHFFTLSLTLPLFGCVFLLNHWCVVCVFCCCGVFFFSVPRTLCHNNIIFFVVLKFDLNFYFIKRI